MPERTPPGWAKLTLSKVTEPKTDSKNDMKWSKSPQNNVPGTCIKNE